MAPRSDPNEKAISKPELNDEQENDEDDEAIDEVGEELSAVDLAEIERVSNHLDSLNSVLDAIEQRNDNIHAQLLELLSSNREIRQSLQQEAEASRTDDAPKDPAEPSADVEMPSTSSEEDAKKE